MRVVVAFCDQEMKERTVFVTARKIRTNVRRRRRGEDESQKRKSVGSGKLRLRFKLLTSYFAEPPPLVEILLGLSRRPTASDFPEEATLEKPFFCPQ